MRVLLLEDGSIEALAMQRELAGRHDVRVAATLAEALAVLAGVAGGGWRPDVVVADLSPADPDGLRVLEALQDAAGSVPVVVSTGGVTAALRRQVDALGAAAAPSPAPYDHGGEAAAGLGLLKAVLGHQHHQHPWPHGALGPQHQHQLRAEIMAEVDRAARLAADAAVARAVGQLTERLGLEDDEGLRTAIRLARGWEAAKGRFLSAVATGIGSAFLLALGAGLVALLRENTGK